jgi:hypothetical protein
MQCVLSVLYNMTKRINLSLLISHTHFNSPITSIAPPSSPPPSPPHPPPSPTTYCQGHRFTESPGGGGHIRPRGHRGLRCRLLRGATRSHMYIDKHALQCTPCVHRPVYLPSGVRYYDTSNVRLSATLGTALYNTRHRQRQSGTGGTAISVNDRGASFRDRQI